MIVSCKRSLKQTSESSIAASNLQVMDRHSQRHHDKVGSTFICHVIVIRFLLNGTATHRWHEYLQ